jgi:demethylmenaquinone methyltransferase/2-methoxy-6-polyprenyl-1,4-benzoquinol methylase
MSSLALMRWLENAPSRYDAGMRWLTLGRAARVHECIARAVPERGHALEIGCGTGTLTERLVAHGARVTALDQNPEMLDLARARLSDAGDAIELLERTAAEIDALPPADFDAVVASFSLSEMSAGERAHVLRAASQRLRPGGVLVVGDEVTPQGRVARLLFALLRVPQALLGWLLAGSVSRPLAALPAELRAAGFQLRDEQRLLLGSLAVFVSVPAS